MMIDFSKMSSNELTAALRRINRDRFPENYEACLAEIERRKEAGQWEEKKDLENPFAEPPSLFSKRRRIFAMLADATFLIFAALAFFPLSSILHRLEHWGFLPYLSFILLYGTLCESTFGKGRTLGKAIFKLRLAPLPGTSLTYSNAALRWLPFAISTVFSSLVLQYSTDFLWVEGVYLILGIFGTLDVLAILFHPQQRSVLDILSNTLVLDARREVPEQIEGFQPLKNLKFAFVAFAVAAALVFNADFLRATVIPSSQNVALKEAVEKEADARFIGTRVYNTTLNGQTATVAVHSFWFPMDEMSDLPRSTKIATRIRLLVHAPENAQASQTPLFRLYAKIYYGLIPSFSEVDFSEKR